MKNLALYSLIVLSLAFQLKINNVNLQDLKETQQDISFIIENGNNIHHSGNLDIELFGFHILSSNLGRSESYAFSNYYELTSYDKYFELGQLFRVNMRGVVYMIDNFDLKIPIAPQQIKEVRIVKFVIF